VRVGAPAPLTLSAVTESPGVLGPGTDGALPPATLSFTLGAPATVTAAVQDATGATVYTIADGLRRAGPSVVRWSPGDVLVDGRYRVVVTARAGGAALTKWAELVVDRTVAGLTAAPAAFSPNHDQVLDSTAFTFVLAQQAAVRLDIVSGGLVVATPFSGTLPAGPASIPWDGTAFGVPLYDGTYRAVLTVTDALGDVPFATPVVIDTRPPTLALVDRSTLTFSLDEPATVTVVVNGTTAIARDERAGTFAIPFQGAVASFSASAVDRAGNVSAALSG
jgi:hypothetical protein